MLAGAAALVYPLLYGEPFGLVVVESMACGTPVVGSRIGAVPELIDEGLTGYLADSWEGITELIRVLAGWTARRSGRGPVERFDYRRMVDRHEALYRRLGVRLSGLLVITAHPDDEVLIAGGTLAARAAAGEPTGVVCLTRGEQGPISDPALATREALGDVRLEELRAACARLGSELVRCYRRQDGNLSWSDGSAIVRQLAGAVTQRRPDR